MSVSRSRPKPRHVGTDSAASSTVDPLPTAKTLTDTEREAVGLVKVEDFDPWEYTDRILKLVEGKAASTASKMWSSYSHVPYLRAGKVKGTVARVWRERDGRPGRRLRSSGRDSPRSAGKSLPLEPRLSRQFNQHNIHLVPSMADVLVRLAGEVMYFQKRQSADDATRAAQYPAIRPPWALFYQRLEARPPSVTFAFTKHSTDLIVIRQERPNTAATSYLAARTAAELAANDSDNGPKLPLLPPIEVLCSLNLVIAAMQERIAQPAPAPNALVIESKQIADFAWILYSMWYMRDGDELRMEALVREAQRLVSLHTSEHAYAPFILQPTDHAFNDLKPPPLPSNTMRNGPQPSFPGEDFLTTLRLDAEPLGGLDMTIESDEGSIGEDESVCSETSSLSGFMSSACSNCNSPVPKTPKTAAAVKAAPSTDLPSWWHDKALHEFGPSGERSADRRIQQWVADVSVDD
ncbi:hypothetical protein Rt10032_c04g2096 [Rhodotorula toruloides]|uniref:Uncharacterized protein n=1 Tax=Rhodotorula toruloides TaxID=5286 RepID=A0A511KCI1_RHOTO|nr:hypothetical protein Rt10032_c04g2096 [Rhodotorula toruloides]